MNKPNTPEAALRLIADAYAKWHHLDRTEPEREGLPRTRVTIAMNDLHDAVNAARELLGLEILI